MENNLTKAQMAVEIAKDVIAQLKKRSNKMIPKTRNGYLHSEYVLSDEESKKDLKSVIPKILKQECYVCARGAAVISKARLFNDVPASELNSSGGGLSLDYDQTTELLSSAFTEKTLDQIESSFELTLPYGGSKNAKTVGSGLVYFGAKYPNAKERLIAIMENIIDNNGVMVVPKETWNKAHQAKYKPIV